MNISCLLAVDVKGEGVVESHTLTIPFERFALPMQAGGESVITHKEEMPAGSQRPGNYVYSLCFRLNSKFYRKLRKREEIIIIVCIAFKKGMKILLSLSTLNSIRFNQICCSYLFILCIVIIRFRLIHLVVHDGR